MKTLSFALGLLLLLTVYSTAMPHGPNEMSPVSCCFQFFEHHIPKAFIRSITKTHSRCSEKGFVIRTPARRTCVRQNVEWAKKAYKQLNSRVQKLAVQ